MELDYSAQWDPQCPRPCTKQPCTGLKFLSIPASLASEMTPKNGAFSNMIVRYENTGEVWIYSDEGVPVKVKDGDNGDE